MSITPTDLVDEQRPSDICHGHQIRISFNHLHKQMMYLVTEFSWAVSLATIFADKGLFT
jgi:hypothetical protein